ncbi:oligosaccharide flippase family protein [bacterium]|nr:oligosaccharide flippase family protein [bacterium]
MDDFTAKTGRDAFKYIPSNAIPALVGVITVPIFTRLFPPDLFGNYALALSTVALLTTIAAQWLRNSIIRFYVNYESEGKLAEYYSTIIGSLLIGVIIISVVLAAVIWSGNFFNEQVEALLLLSLLPFVGNSLILLGLSFLRASRKAWSFSLFRSLHAIGKPLLGILLVVFLKFSISGLLLGIFLAGALLVPFIFRTGRVFSQLKFSKFSPRAAREFFLFGFPVTLTLISMWLLNLSNRYIIEILRGSVEVGLYSISYTISERALTMVFSILMLAAYPIIVEAWEKEGKELTANLIKNLSRYFFIICTPIAVFLSVLSKDVIMLFAPESYLESYKVMPLIIACIYVNGILTYVIKGFELSKKTYLLSALVFVSGVINVLLTIILVSSFGFIGAGYANLISFVILFLLSYWYSRKYLKWSAPLATIIKVLLSSGIMGVVVYFISSFFNPLFSIIISVFAGFSAYFIALRVLRETSIRELLKFFGLFK